MDLTQANRLCIVKCVRNRAEPVQAVTKLDMVVMQLASNSGRDLASGMMMPRTKGAQRIEDHGHIDHLLDECGGDRREPADGRCKHGQQGQAHTNHNALQRDATRALGNHDRFAHAIKPICQDHDIGRFR